MKLIHSFASVVLALGILSLAGIAETVKPAADQPVVQLAILLDTSNSMDGLIAQAKADTLGVAVTKAVREQASKKGVVFEKK